MSLFFQHIVDLYSNGEYSKVREELHNFEIQYKPFPNCIYRELDYAESNTYRQIRNEDVFPIRFLWLFELKDQVMMGVAMPLERSFYNPVRLYEMWLIIAADAAFRQELEQDDVLFDLENRAISMKRGWVYIGDTFIDDLLEIEAFYGEELMVPDMETGIARPMFVGYKTIKKWQNGAIVAVRYETERKPRKCPACSSHRIANILYGMPEYTDELQKDMNSGRIVLGGCCITNDDPRWQCADCQMAIYFKRSTIKEKTTTP